MEQVGSKFLDMINDKIQQVRAKRDRFATKLANLNEELHDLEELKNRAEGWEPSKPKK